MTQDEYKQYLKDLEAAVEDSVVKIAEDIKTPRPRTSYPNPGIKVGDWVTHRDGRTTYPARVVQVTDKSYTYEVYEGKCDDILGLYSLESMFTEEEREQRGISIRGDTLDGSIFIPYKGNEDMFSTRSKKTRRFPERNNTIPSEDEVHYYDCWHEF
jgi:hypothetical protein